MLSKAVDYAKEYNRCKKNRLLIGVDAKVEEPKDNRDFFDLDNRDNYEIKDKKPLENDKLLR